MNHKTRTQIRVWRNAWVEITEGIIKILTLAYWRPNWSFLLICRGAINDMKRRMKNGN